MADMNLEESLEMNGDTMASHIPFVKKLKIRIVERENEIEGDVFFRPDFMHQIVDDEKLNEDDFKSSNICFDPTFTYSYIFDDPTSLEPKSINEFLLKFLPNNKNILLFKENLINLPSLESIGKIIHTYKDDDDGFTYETCHADFSDNEIARYYMGLQILCLMYIDASSVLDTTDDKWNLFFLFKKTEKYRQFIGYSAVYQFYSFPDKIRARIGHFLILPPYQCKGHGYNFLKNIMHYYCSNDNVFDISLEDPSEDMLYLTDLLNCQQVMNMPEFKNIDSSSKFNIKISALCKSQYKMNYNYSIRVFEILKLNYTLNNRKDEEKYRQEVLGRLNTGIARERKRLEKIKNVISEKTLSSLKNTLDSRERQNEDSLLYLFESYLRVITKLEK